MLIPQEIPEMWLVPLEPKPKRVSLGATHVSIRSTHGFGAILHRISAMFAKCVADLEFGRQRMLLVRSSPAVSRSKQFRDQKYAPGRGVCLWNKLAASPPAERQFPLRNSSCLTNLRERCPVLPTRLGSALGILDDGVFD